MVAKETAAGTLAGDCAKPRHPHPLNPNARRFCSAVENFVWATMPWADRQVVNDCREKVAAHETGHAVVLACYGHLPHEVRMYHKELWTGETLTAPDDPLTAGLEGKEIGSYIRVMCSLAAGYIGERCLIQDTMRASHELGMVMWLSIVLGDHYDISAERLLRATLAECETCLTDNRQAALDLKCLLEQKGCASKEELASLLGNAKQRDPVDWLQTAGRADLDQYDNAICLMRVCARLYDLETRALIEAEQLFKEHEKVVLQISGGKDSLACLHLLQPYWDRITVAWVNTGAAFPETVDLMSRIRAMVPHFNEVKSNQPDYVALMGMPADVVPVRNTAVGHLMQPGGGVLVQPYWECCGANIWQPMQRAVLESGATLIIRGQRADEKRRAPISSGYTESGLTIWFPIEAWTACDAFDYLRSRGAEVPKHYEYTATSLDCTTCTAFLDENMGKMRYMRDKHPVLWKQLEPRLRQVRDAARAELAHVEAALQVDEGEPVPTP